MSFAPSADIRRTLKHGLSLGANRVVALLPKGAYGVIAEREMRRTLDENGGQVVSVVHYRRDANSMVEAARTVCPFPLAAPMVSIFLTGERYHCCCSKSFKNMAPAFQINRLWVLANGTA